jgi:EmrB/QacA subfamily drug resistance transporter
MSATDVIAARQRKAGREPFTGMKRLLPWLVAVAFFMEALDTTILNTAVPAISRSLDVTPLAMKAALSCYTLSLAVFIPISGWMADRFGTRRVFASAIGLFTLSSLLCGLSRNIEFLVACRIVQGCGGAMMLPVGRLTLLRFFSKIDRVRALSFVAVPGLVGPMLGPVVGGLIVSALNWRFIFFVNIPIGLAGLYLVGRYLPDYRDADKRPFDTAGFLLFGGGIALLSYVLEVFGEHTLNAAGVAGLLAVSFVLLTAYGVHTARAARPLMQLSLFRIRTFSTAVIGGFFTRLGIGGLPFLLPLLYQIGLGLPPAVSGLLIMPQAFGAISMKFIVPRILERFNYRPVLLTNTIVLGCFLAAFSTFGHGTPLWLIAIQAYLYGGLTSLQYTCMNTMAYVDTPERQASSATSIANTAQQMSVSFGVALAAMVAALFLPDHARANPDQMISGLHHAFWVLGGFTILSTALFLRLKPGDSVTGSGERDAELA